MSLSGRLATVRRVGLTQILLARSWILLKGDDRARSRLRVPEGALVVDVGAFQGEFTAYARDTWNARVLAIEPVPEFADALLCRFVCDEQVTVVEAALGASTGTAKVSVEADGSSAWGGGDRIVTVLAVDAAQLLEGRDVALLKINAEGAEYDILERLMATKLMDQIGTIQVQFHKFVPGARQRRRRIREQMRRTHQCTWSVPWVWEQWQRRGVEEARP